MNPCGSGRRTEYPGSAHCQFGVTRQNDVPALVSPRVRDALRLEHDVLDAALLQRVAHRQARLTAADDDHGMMLELGRSRRVARAARRAA